MKPFIAISTLALAAHSVNAHGYLSQPAANFPNGIDTSYNALLTESSDPAFAGLKWNDNPEANTAMFTKTFPKTQFKTLRALMDTAAKDCGKTVLTGTPVDVSALKSMKWQNDQEKKGFVTSHHGPCEAWIDDTRVAQSDDCVADYSGYPAEIPIDFSSCSGKCTFTFYWLAMHEPKWQVYKQCAPITNGGGGGGAPAAQIDAGSSAETPAAPTTPATDETPASADTSSGSTTPSAKTPASTPAPADEPVVQTESPSSIEVLSLLCSRSRYAPFGVCIPSAPDRVSHAGPVRASSSSAAFQNPPRAAHRPPARPMSSSPVKTTHTQTTVRKTLVHAGEPEKKTVTTTSHKTYVFTSETGEEVVLDLKDAATTRPHARKVGGSVVASEFTHSSATFVLEYKSEGAEPTEIFVPYVHFPGGYRVTASDGHCAIEKHEGYDIIKHEHDSHAHTHRVVVEKTKKAAPAPARFAWHGHSNIPVYVALAVAVVSPYLTW
ncbi:unnamed protein product [Phytophthora lilii]|uniref:Unnamed protein product n=1 Tax=Phytophthora lilii TaxID=2077276 RepID=A0A9W6X1M3_9STRA|nr:unnamed protein product [Phytophthora lilii]